MSKSLNVLFIEDSAEDAELTTSELKRGGFLPRTERVDTEQDMRRALNENAWDIIICDFRMPNFSAEAALSTLQKSGLDIPFIITSGAVDADATVTLLKQGAHDFMNKEALARLVPAIERELREADVRRQRRLAESQVRLLSSAMQQSPVSVLITDAAGTIEYANYKFEQLSGFSVEEVIGKPLSFSLIDQQAPELLQNLQRVIAEGSEWRGEFCSLRRDKQVLWENVSISPLRQQNQEITNFIIIKEDITVRRSYEEKLLRKAHYDDLTGLANRSLMTERLHHALAQAKHDDHSVAILCIDLDRFKHVNDSLGHAIGDEVIKEAASRLSACVREGDTLARMGGDEFIIILPQTNEQHTAIRTAQKITYLFEEPFIIHNVHYCVTSSIGIARYPHDGLTPAVLQRNADLAMYKAKDLGRNRFHCYSEDINTQLIARLELESRLRHPQLCDQLELHYQPIFNVLTDELIGVEALVRWRTEDGSLSMPIEFISAAEDIGIIQHIDRWVMTRACKEIAVLSRELRRPLRLALNVSPHQLKFPDFCHFVAKTLERNQLSAPQLELEITERTVLETDQQTLVNIQHLCDMGARLAIDDFGTGYSSLAYLQKFPFNTLKIDRSFIRELCNNTASSRLVDTIITMAHSLSMEVVAEGIEDENQLKALKARGCDFAQGYYLSRPLPLISLKELLRLPH